MTRAAFISFFSEYLFANFPNCEHVIALAKPVLDIIIPMKKGVAWNLSPSKRGKCTTYTPTRMRTVKKEIEKRQRTCLFFIPK